MARPLIAPEYRYPEELEALALQVGLRLEALGVAADDAQRIAWEVAEYLRQFWGGHKKYLRAQRERDAAQLDLLGTDGGAAPENPILADLAAQVSERLVGIGTAPEEAATMGADTAAHLARYIGTGDIYICKGHLYEISLRDQEIYHRYSNGNYEWLAREYNMTIQHIYRIVKRVGAIERAKRQAALFPDESR